MGVKGLWKIISGRDIEPDELDGKRLCVDGNLVLFACLGSENVRYVTEYTLEVVGRLLALGVDPIMVFDGRKPGFKKHRPVPPIAADLSIPDAPSESAASAEEWPQPFAEQPEWWQLRARWAPPRERLEELSMEEFSAMQVSKIVERRHLFRSIKERMHGDTSLHYSLKRKKQAGQPEQPGDTERLYEQTETEMDKLVTALLGQPLAERPPAAAAPRSPSPAPAPAPSPAPEPSIQPVLEIPCELAQSEYQRQTELYALPAADQLLNSETATRHSLSLSLKLILDVLDILQVKYVLAPAESDAVYANLEAALNTDGVVTDDSDALLFSTRPVYRHVFKRAKPPQVYRERASPIPYRWAELVLFAWLLGSDYSPGVKGFGLHKSKKLVDWYREHLPERDGALPADEQLIDIECLAAAFRAVDPGFSLSGHLAELLRLRRVYSETHFKVKVEHLRPSPVSLPQLAVFLAKKTAWGETKGRDFVKLVEHTNQRRK